MAAIDLSSLAQLALVVAREAGKHVLLGHRSAPAIARKLNYADLVTRFDVESEQRIRKMLSERTPEIPIVGEEQGGSADDRPTWFVDPIDGTMNFAHGHAYFAVSIGLMERGKPLAGAVVAPALHTEWHGFIGGGAFRNGQVCRVSANSALQDALVATGFSPLMSREGSPEDNLAALSRVSPAVQGIRRCGAAALDLCMVADGTYEAYWERKLSPWDSAAGAALVLAAGGKVTSLLGEAADLTRGYLLASNGEVHDGLLRLLLQDGAPS
ncbi:MAG TPA: inositol monophosphatase family protein [Polyangiales bacterium]|jgi:myo-inositol-1(or 4)-monophosphatase